jgi:hypothetical protein
MRQIAWIGMLAIVIIAPKIALGEIDFERALKDLVEEAVNDSADIFIQTSLTARGVKLEADRSIKIAGGFVIISRTETDSAGNTEIYRMFRPVSSIIGIWSDYELEKREEPQGGASGRFYRDGYKDLCIVFEHGF